MTTSALTLQLLAWVAARPRTYGETMEAWRTTCPRLTIWEDAVSDGLVSVDGAASLQGGRVLVTDSGRALLAATSSVLRERAALTATAPRRRCASCRARFSPPAPALPSSKG